MNVGRNLRALRRFLGFWGVALACMGDFIRRYGVAPRNTPRTERARWAMPWARRFLNTLGVQVESIGPAPQTGVLVSNHVSYLDILVLSTVCPTVFISKAQIAHWPIIGFIASSAGTLYLQRERKRDLQGVASALKPAVEEGSLVTFFPEGTTSDGERILPFRASLFQPAAELGWPVHVSSLRYHAHGGVTRSDVCYWGDMQFAPHLWRLCGVRSTRCVVRFADSDICGVDRKALAREAQAIVETGWRLSGARVQDASPL